MLLEHNTELGQCIEAMEVNIEAFGYRLVSRIKPLPGEKLDEDLAADIKGERAKLVNFFAYATKDSFVQFRRKLQEGFGVDR